MNIFDHIKTLVWKNESNKLDKLNSEEKSSWNAYQVIRWLSHHPDTIDIADELNVIQDNLTPEQIFDFIYFYLPRGQKIQYVKKKKPTVDFEAMKIVMRLSELEAIDALTMIHHMSSDEIKKMKSIYK